MTPEQEHGDQDALISAGAARHFCSLFVQQMRSCSASRIWGGSLKVILTLPLRGRPGPFRLPVSFLGIFDQP